MVKVGDLIKELAQHDFDSDVQVMVNGICQVDIDDLYTRFNQYKVVTLFVKVVLMN